MRLSTSTISLALAATTATAQYCEPELNDLCFEEHTTESGVTFRLAIPAGAEEGFPAALQIVAPTEVGWVGFSWGGTMTNCPLSVAWKNGEDVTISPRLATEYTLPNVTTDATLTALPGSGANETHWTATFLCEGCTKWDYGLERALDPNGESVPFAWASGADAPADPADPASGFGRHDETGGLSWSLLAAQEEGFEEAVGAQ